MLVRIRDRVFGMKHSEVPAKVPSGELVLTDGKGDLGTNDNIPVETSVNPVSVVEKSTSFQSGVETVQMPVSATVGKPGVTVAVTPEINFSSLPQAAPIAKERESVVTPSVDKDTLEGSLAVLLAQKSQGGGTPRDLQLLEARIEATQEQLRTLDKPSEEKSSSLAVEVTEDEAKLHQLLQELKDKDRPAQERAATMKQVADLKNSTKPPTLTVDKIAALRERVENEKAAALAEADRIQAQKAKLGIEILKHKNEVDRLDQSLAAITNDLALLERQLAEKQANSQTSRKRSQKKGDAVDGVLAKLQGDQDRILADQTSFTQKRADAEAAYNEAVNAFLALPDASDTEIQELIRENIEPVVAPNDTVEIPTTEEGQAIAEAILAERLAGPAGENVVEPALEHGEGTLEERITQARNAYVEKDIETTNYFKRLARSFTQIDPSEAERNPDVQALRTRYHDLLHEKKTKDLEALKGATGAERDALALQIGTYFLVDEQLNLAEAYQEFEKEHVGNKLLKTYHWIGEQYNKLSWKQKAMVAAACFGGSMALAATGGAGIAAGAGVIGVRRFLAGAGGTVAMDTLFERWQKRRAAKGVEKIASQVEDVMYEVAEDERVAPENKDAVVRKMEAFLASEAKDLDTQIAKKRVKTLFRKWSARALGSFGGVLGHYLFLEGAEEIAETEVGSAVIETAQAIPEQVAETLPESGAMVEQAQAALEPVVSLSLPLEYQITQADGARGLWGILEKNVPLDGLDTEHKNQALSSLKNLIAVKLEALSPEAQTKMGFPSGSVDTLYAGDTLKLHELLSDTEIKDIVDGKIIDAPIVDTPEVAEAVTAEPVDQPVAASVDEAVREATAPQAPVVASLENVSGASGGVSVLESSSTATEQGTSVEGGHTPQELLAGPERQEYITQVAGLRQAIFQTPETANWLSYSYVMRPALGNITVDKVLEAQTLLGENPQAPLNIDLHQSQVARIATLSQEAFKVYGAEARPVPGEKINEYTLRLAALGFEPGSETLNLNKIKSV